MSKAEAKPQLTVADEAIDFTKFEGIGVPARVAWFASAVLYGTASLTFLVLALATELVPWGIAVFSILGMVMAGLCLVGAKHFTDAWWGGHFRSLTGMLIIIGGAFVMKDVHSATAIVMLYPMLVTAYLYDARRSLPYVVAGTAYFLVTLLFMVNDPSARAIATATIIGGISAVIVLSQNELRKIVNVNRDLAVTDALTGVANVRRLRSFLQDRIDSADAGSGRPAVFGIDLDDFKEVNDNFSHTRGDEVLKEVAAEISAIAGNSALVARRGGDEFAVLVPNGTGRELDAFAEDIGEAVIRARTRVCPQVNTNASVAYVVHTVGEAADSLLERCDNALHEAKLDAHPERRDETAEVVSMRSFRRRRAGVVGRADHLVGSDSEMISSELQMAHTIRRALGNASSWNVFAIMNFASALAISGALATKTGAAITSTLPMVAALGLMVQGGLAMFAAQRDIGERLMHAQLLGMIFLISLAVWSAGELQAYLADIFLAPVVCAVYSLDARRVLPYLLAGLALFSAALIDGAYPYNSARLAVTGVIVLVMIGLLAKARRTTREFTAHAVELSTIDPLTELANLRGMRRGVAEAIERCTLTGDILAFIAVDLDEFKLVNDLHSHTVGDRMLIAVAEAMRKNARAGDLVARRGGDEFAFVSAVADEHEHAELVERLREEITEARRSVVLDATSTVSVGTVVWRRGEDADTFLARADEELHGAKQRSREQRADGSMKFA